VVDSLYFSILRRLGIAFITVRAQEKATKAAPE
jgi:hypothetical protein